MAAYKTATRVICMVGAAFFFTVGRIESCVETRNSTRKRENERQTQTVPIAISKYVLFSEKKVQETAIYRFKRGYEPPADSRNLD